MTSALERFGVFPGVAVLAPQASGRPCFDSDVVDLATELANNRSVTSVDLSGVSMSAEATTALAGALAKHRITAVQHVKLANCNINGERFEAIATAMTQSPKIEVVELNNNPLRDTGAMFIASLIEHSTALRVLDLTGCKIGPSGARAIGAALAKNTKLRNLSLSNNKLCATGATSICDGLASTNTLSILDLSGNGINCDGGMVIARLLRESENIESVNLSRNYLSSSTPYVASALSKRKKQVRLLDLSDNHIDATVCKSMAQVLEGSSVSIACLSLDYNPIGDDGVVALFHALKGTQIQFLDLSECSLKVHSGVVLADLIAGCPQLNSFQVDGNELGDDALTEILTAVAKTGNVAALNLERTGAGNGAMAALCRVAATTSLRSLNISENKSVNIESVLDLLRVFNNRSSLEELDLSDLALEESEDLLSSLVQLFFSNPGLEQVLLERTGVGKSIPQAILTREFAMTLATATGGAPLPQQSMNYSATNNSGAIVAANNTINSNTSLRSGNMSGALNATQSAHQTLEKSTLHRKLEESIRPAWALAVPLEGSKPKLSQGVEDEDADDGRYPPMIPHPASLHHPLYPGYGNGRFSNANLLQTLTDPVPHNVAVSHGDRKPFVPSCDGSSLVKTAPRRAMKESPFSLHALENNPGQLPVTDDQLRRKFNELDVDGNGTLDREEFKKIYATFQSFGIPMTEKEINRVFDKYAGHDRRISYDEFCMMMLNVAAR